MDCKDKDSITINIGTKTPVFSVIIDYFYGNKIDLTKLSVDQIYDCSKMAVL